VSDRPFVAPTVDDIQWELSPVDAHESSLDEPSDLLVDALLEAQSYRLLAQQALHRLHAITIERDLLREQRSIDRRRTREQQRQAAAA